jgi:hypothetical protein
MNSHFKQTWEGSLFRLVDYDPTPESLLADFDKRWCALKKWFVFDLDTEAIAFKDFCCGSWGCSDCIEKLRWKWSNIIGLGVQQVSRLRFLTLTGFPADPRQASRSFGNLIRDIRAAGYAFEYLSFNEIGSGGMRHKHLLLHGDFIPQAFISARCKANGLGGIVWISELRGRKAVVDYIMKYIGKDPATWSGRKFSYSRRFFLGKTSAQIWGEFLRDFFGEVGQRLVFLIDYLDGEGGVVPASVREKIKHNTTLLADKAGHYWLEYKTGAIERISGFRKTHRSDVY